MYIELKPVLTADIVPAVVLFDDQPAKPVQKLLVSVEDIPAVGENKTVISCKQLPGVGVTVKLMVACDGLGRVVGFHVKIFLFACSAFA